METFTSIDFQQARDFSKKLNVTFEFLKQNFKPLFKSLLFIAGPPMLIGSILAGGLYSDYLGFISSVAQNPQAGQEGLENYFSSLTLWLEIGGAALMLMVSGVMIVSVVYNYMLEYESKKSNQIDVNTVWDRVRDTLPMYVGTMLLYWLLLIVAYLALVLLVAGAAAISGLIAFIIGLALGIGLVYAIVTLSLLFFIRGYEKKGFFAAVSRSFQLIRDKWWSTFGLLFILGLIQSTIASIFLIPWYVNFVISMMHSLETNTFQEPSFLSQLINNVFMTLYFIASFLLYALPLIALAFQYFNLVELKESKGLLSRIDTIGQQAPPPSKDEQY